MLLKFHENDDRLKACVIHGLICKNRTDESVCATSLLDGLALRNVSVEIEDAALELDGLET